MELKGKHVCKAGNFAIRAKKIVTRGGLTGSSEQVVVPKVSVTRDAQRYEPKNEERSVKPDAAAVCPSRSGIQTSVVGPSGQVAGLSSQGGDSGLAGQACTCGISGRKVWAAQRV